LSDSLPSQKFIYVKRLAIFVVFLNICSFLQAQEVEVRGKLVDAGGLSSFEGFMVINKRTGTGFFGESSGNFYIKVNKNDTIMLGAYGYKTISICMADSVDKSSYFVQVYLPKLQYDLKEVEIFPERELKQVYKDIEKLGFEPKDYILSGIDAVYHPITFLYQSYSRRERQKRLAYELINDEKRRDLLKELFKKYVNHNIIALDDSQFDSFIDFIQVDDYFLKSSSQYDFIMFVKFKYEEFEALNDYSRRARPLPGR
jgi:hypothetical protein